MVNLDEDVHVIESQPAWPAMFASERARIMATLGDSAAHLEHIGSTAVPGLKAKPIVDMMLGSVAFPPTVELMETLTALGYEDLGEAGVPGRLYFRRRGDTSYNLHVVSYRGDHWNNNLRFRDYLLHSAAARERYAAAKLDALTSGATSLIAYSEAKSRIVGELMMEAAIHANNSRGGGSDR